MKGLIHEAVTLSLFSSRSQNYPHYSNQGGFPGAAVRAGRWKLIENHEDGRLKLYDLEADPGETVDVAAERLARFLGAAVDLMKVLARAAGHRHLGELDVDDLTTFKLDMADLTGVAYGGVGRT